MPIAIPLPVLFALGGAAAVAASQQKDAIDAAIVAEVKARPNPKKPVEIKKAKVSQEWLDNRPLPQEALDAYADKNNKMRSLGTPHWFRWAKFSTSTKRKVDKLRFYSSPPGALYLKSYNDVFNLSWMARCPSKWYPKYGHRDQSCRVNSLKPVLGPKADWKTLTGAYKDILEEVPAMVESAGLITGAVASGGASAAQDPAGLIEKVSGTVKNILVAYGGIIKGSKARVAAANALIVGVGLQYQAELIAANPHILVPFGPNKPTVGKHFMENPKTYGDLRKPGKARPLLLNPALNR